MDVKEALELIPYGNCLLFVGSGFSFGARLVKDNPDGSARYVRSASDIANELYRMCGEPESELDGNLTTASQLFLDTVGRAKLVEMMRDEFIVRETTDDQNIVASLPWMRVYTTNYDEIVEKAAAKTGHQIEKVWLSKNFRHEVRRRNTCVHLNGCISNMTVDTLDNEVKLTNRSYLDEQFRYNPWFNQFKDDLYSADAVFFVGFSGAYDLDLRRTFEGTKELREKSFFIVYEKEGRKTTNIIERFGTVEKIGLSGFATLLKKYDIVNIKPIVRPDVFKSFVRPVIRKFSPEIKALDFLRLISEGYVNTHCLDYGLREPAKFPYCIYRSQIDSIAAYLRNGERHFVLQSDLGNGKTLFLESLAYYLQRKDFNVFVFRSETNTTRREIETICTDYPKPVFLIDNYSDHLEILKSISRSLPDDGVVALTERTSRYELYFNNIDFFGHPFQTIDINTLTTEEAARFVELLNRYGVWGKYAAEASGTKRDIITNACQGQISKVILKLIDSDTQLLGKIKDVVKAIQQKGDFYQALLYVLFSNYFQFDLSFHDLTENLSGNSLNNPAFRQDPNIREFVEFDEETIKFKSSILAMHVLKRQLSSRDIVDGLKRIFTDLNKHYGSKRVRKQIKKLLNYRDLSRIVNSNKAIFEYYENIADMEACKNNPHFWLQFAIGRTSDRDYGDALIYFNTAYSLAKDRYGDGDTYQIDTHYAHYMLWQAIDIDIPEDEKPYDIFEKADNLLKSGRNGDEFRHFIYNVADDYDKFYFKYVSRMTPTERVKVKEACKAMIRNAKKYLSHPGTNDKRMVQRVMDELYSVVKS